MPNREIGGEYSTYVKKIKLLVLIGLIFIFNLIVGTGSLTLPAVFAKTGWLLGLVLIMILAFISYVTVTFIIETMACANAILHWRRLHILKQDRQDGSDRDRDDNVTAGNSSGFVNNEIIQNDESNSFENDSSDQNHQLDETEIEVTPLFAQNSRYYILDSKIEIGEMAGLFLNNYGRIFFYFCIIIYLYGDLSIYSAAVAKSLRDVICHKFDNTSANDDTLNDKLCWNDHTMTRLECYRLSLIGFILMLGPFAFFNVTKTKYIQMLTTLLRWFAFSIMIFIAMRRLVTIGKQGNPPLSDFAGIPALFGACVYSFMCHHSLPSLIAPISKKNHIKILLSFDYVIICCFYLFLAFTGAFAFSNLNDLYTLNFVPDTNQTSILLKATEYFLAMFPVFTLSTSFPIIAITLRNNLKTLFLDKTRLSSYNYFTRKILFPLLSIIPPIFITYFTDSVTNLVGFTGSYAGNAIQYIIPILLVYYARRKCKNLLGRGIVNEYASPFKSNLWLIFVFVWSITCIIFVTTNFFIKIK